MLSNPSPPISELVSCTKLLLSLGVSLGTCSNSNVIAPLTTAAAIWIVAAIGVAVGAGLWRTSLVALALALFVLVVGEAIDGWLHKANPPK